MKRAAAAAEHLQVNTDKFGGRIMGRAGRSTGEKLWAVSAILDEKLLLFIELGEVPAFR